MDFENSIKFLDDLIRERPILSEKAEKFISAYSNLQPISNDKSSDDNENEENENNEDVDENLSSERAKSIKESSPFTQHFN
ncbi:unnamed protein product, partial [Brachionus calyciflorus]